MTNPPEKTKVHQSSFRDPSGYVTHKDGLVQRHINPVYFDQYQQLTDAGVYKNLIKSGLLISHTEISRTSARIIIEPEQIPFITYPYEWSFEQYKHAALLTLKIHRYALSKGFILKDASAFNVTFHKGSPVFIDTLSFDFYEEGSPWRAYKQFITHFLGPLVLAKYHGTEMLKTLSTHIDGIPVKLLSSLLPWKTYLSPALYTNIHLLAKMEEKYSDDYEGKSKRAKLSKKAQNNIIESLYDFIKKLTINQKTEWGDYYQKTNYSTEAFTEKAQLIKKWAKNISAKKVIDVGGNDGTFGRELQTIADEILVSDIDANAVDANYRTLLKNKESTLIPFVNDVLNPAPAIGFNHTERSAFIERISAYKPDLTLALALIHHISLSGNVPFEKSAEFFARFSKNLIIEFPTRDDSWVNSLLIRKREFINHFDFYNKENFETDYARYFKIVKKQTIAGSQRILYFLERNS